MWYRIKQLSVRTLQFLYSGAQGFSTTATVATSAQARFGPSSYGLIAAGTIGLADAVQTASFPGNAAYHNIMGRESPELSITREQQAAWWKKSAYYAMNYSLVVLILLLHWLEIYFLAGNLKPYFTPNDVDHEGTNRNDVYAPLSDLEMVLVTLYVLLMDVDFDATNAIWATCEQMQHTLGVNDRVARKLKRLARPLLNNRFYQHKVRVTGSLAHTLEHIGPNIVVFVPVHLLHTVSLSTKTIILTLTAIASIAISIPILGETYYFDGRESMENMRSLENSDDKFQYDLANIYGKTTGIASINDLEIIIKQSYDDEEASQQASLNDLVCTISMEDLVEFLYTITQSTPLDVNALCNALDEENLGLVHHNIAKSMTIVLPRDVLPAFKRCIQAFGPLTHAVGVAMPIIQGGKYIKLSPLLTYGVAGVSALLMLIGNYWSEAKVSAKEIDQLQQLLLFYKELDTRLKPSETHKLINSG